MTCPEFHTSGRILAEATGNGQNHVSNWYINLWDHSLALGMTAHFVWWWEEAAIRKHHFGNSRHSGANRRFFPCLPTYYGLNCYPLNKTVMNKIILFNMISLDGYFEGPNNEIDWHNVDPEFNDFAIEQLNSASALIFGRITYELMAGYWPSSSALKNDPIVANLMNSIPKVVFSKTIQKASWNNTTILSEVTDDKIKGLKDQYKKDIYIFGSANLASTFTSYNLIDEYRLMINPVVLGKGIPLFKLLTNRLKLKLNQSRSFKSGNILLNYKST